MREVWVIMHDWKTGITTSVEIEGIFLSEKNAKDAFYNITMEYYQEEHTDYKVSDWDDKTYYAYKGSDYRHMWIEIHNLDDAE